VSNFSDAFLKCTRAECYITALTKEENSPVRIDAEGMVKGAGVGVTVTVTVSDIVKCLTALATETEPRDGRRRWELKTTRFIDIMQKELTSTTRIDVATVTTTGVMISYLPPIGQITLTPIGWQTINMAVRERKASKTG
jgi:hypothetical protein